MGSASRPKRMMAQAARLVGRFVAISPKNAAEGTALCQSLAVAGIPSTLGKFSAAGDDPSAIVREYCAAATLLSASRSFYLSVKPPALDYRLDYVREIAKAAFDNGQPIHLDSHGYDTMEPTLDLLHHLIDAYPDVPMLAGWRFGLTVPTRWKRSVRDAEWAIERGVRLRLVKGEFAAAKSDEVDPGRAMLDLLQRWAPRVPALALATHDVPLAGQALSLARCSSIEVELLYGFQVKQMIALAKQFNARVGFYVPYGPGLLLYGLRHLAVNPHKLGRPNPLEMIGGAQAKLARIVAAG